ncbi:unnamed protein product, partial [Anisakis simplex]|uniref:Protein dachsous n=1 Tax=Anisakis simplex TaxID=6269 RepID=A0A0M3KBL0_ANISI
MKLLITLIILLSSSDQVQAFSERQLHFEITEGVPNGTLIGRVTYPATGQHLHDSSSRNEIAQNGKHEQKGRPIPKEEEEPGEQAQFRLSGQCDFASFEPKSGEIRTAVERLDREAIREANATFRMVLVSPGHANIITVHVHVLDINDNQPVFPSTLQVEFGSIGEVGKSAGGSSGKVLAYCTDGRGFGPGLGLNVSVVESAAIGTRIALQSARDADLGENGTIVEYRIISEDSEQEQQPVFSLVHSTDSTATTSGNDLLLLELQRELDRETRDFYVFNISAADGGDPPRFGYSTVHVHVLDTNDNAPKFERSHYEVFVSPNSLDEINHQLVTVHARDADSGRNGRISYRLSGAGAGGEEQFGIWTENGTIFAKERNLNCSRTTATTSTVNPSTGDLNSSSIDSKSRLCVISVEAQDDGEPPLAGHAFVNVWLTESNDHDPVIHFRMYPPESRFASISEAAQVGDTIAVVTVTDEDYGQTAAVRIADQGREDNSKVDQAAERGRQTSDGNSADLFRLESGQNFGVVRLNRPLTNEDLTNQPFRIKLIATDNGYPLARQAHRTLQVFVLRRNETAPQLHAEAIELHLRDDAPIGALVTVVRAQGAELMNFSIVTPVGTVDKSSNPEAFFRIGEHSGVITVARSLRDIQQNRKNSASPRTHQLQVDVRTARPSLKSARCAVTIHIDSVRRRPPVFEKKQYSIEVPEDIALQSVLLTVRALYQDSADNSSQISYSIVESAARTMFAVREKTGEIVLRRHLDRE